MGMGLPLAVIVNEEYVSTMNVAEEAEVNDGGVREGNVVPGSTLPAEHCVSSGTGRACPAWSTPGQRRTCVGPKVTVVAMGILYSQELG